MGAYQLIYKIAVIVMVICWGLVSDLQAQIKVLDRQTNLPLKNVTIKEEQAAGSWLTDSTGQAAISFNSKARLLKFSLMGYKFVEKDVDQSMVPLTVFLEPLVMELEEVELATGYQKLKKERLTGSYTVLDSALLNRRISTNILSRMEDLVPGLVFNRDASTSGALSISIRGVSTVNSDAQPLIVLDNFPFNGSIEDINPNDIESISVLKDASAAAIWGAKAGNGVIVLTSKKAKFNHAQQIQFNVNTTFAPRPDLFQVPVMSTSDYIAIERKLFAQGYYSAIEKSVNHLPLSPVVELLIAQRDNQLTAVQLEAELTRLSGHDVRNDYSKYLYQNALNQQYSFSINGGSQFNNYAISLGLDRNAEGLKRNSFERKTLALSHSLKLWKDRISWSNSINYTLSDRENNNQGHHYLGPNGGVLYPYAELKGAGGENLASPRSLRNSFIDYATSKGLLDWNYRILDDLQASDNVYHTDNLNLNTSLQVKLLKGVSVNLLYQWNRIANVRRQEFGMDSYFTRNLINRFTIVNADQSLTRPIPLGAIVDWDNAKQDNRSFRSQLNINQQFGKSSNFNGLFGYEIRMNELQGQRYRWYGYDDEFEVARAVDYLGSYVSFVNSGARNNQIPNNDGMNRLNDRYRSLFSNLIYTLKEKYILSASARLDQSNLFGVNANQKGVPLWSLGAAWNLSREEFFEPDQMPDLKLRLSYGYNGNINKSLSAYTTAIYNNGANTQNKLVFATIQNPPNPDLRWERVQIMNAGIDFSSRNKKIVAVIDVYKKNGLDLIGTSPMAPASGVVQFTGNTANTRTFGSDISVQLTQKIAGVSWQSNLSYSLVNEKVTAYHLPSANFRYLQSISLPREGFPLFAIYAYRSAGLDPLSGDPRGFLNGQPSINYQQIKNLSSFDAIEYLGPARPTSFGAFRNSFTVKNFSVSFNISYRFGYYFRKPSIVYGNEYGLGGHGDYYQRWQNPGDELHTVVPSVPKVANVLRDEFYLNSEVLVDKGDHIRFQDISLTYDLGKSFSKFKLRGVKVYGYLNNVGLLWKANKWGIDPDYHLMRPARSVALGLKIDI